MNARLFIPVGFPAADAEVPAIGKKPLEEVIEFVGEKA
jgi:hypothetical protein